MQQLSHRAFGDLHPGDLGIWTASSPPSTSPRAHPDPLVRHWIRDSPVGDWRIQRAIQKSALIVSATLGHYSSPPISAEAADTINQSRAQNAWIARMFHVKQRHRQASEAAPAMVHPPEVLGRRIPRSEEERLASTLTPTAPHPPAPRIPRAADLAFSAQSTPVPPRACRRPDGRHPRAPTFPRPPCDAGNGPSTQCPRGSAASAGESVSRETLRAEHPAAARARD